MTIRKGNIIYRKPWMKIIYDLTTKMIFYRYLQKNFIGDSRKIRDYCFNK